MLDEAGYDTPQVLITNNSRVSFKFNRRSYKHYEVMSDQLRRLRRGCDETAKNMKKELSKTMRYFDNEVEAEIVTAIDLLRCGIKKWDECDRSGVGPSVVKCGVVNNVDVLALRIPMSLSRCRRPMFLTAKYADCDIMYGASLDWVMFQTASGKFIRGMTSEEHDDEIFGKKFGFVCR